MNLKQGMLSASMMYALASGMVYNSDTPTLRNGVDRKHYKWEDIQLSKSERKGKTFEQMQELRKQKYEELYKGEK